MNKSPNFIGIGAQKAGSSWLYHQLKTHPEIWMPPLKELHYFDQLPGNEVRHWAHRLLGRTVDDDRWRRQFKHRLKAYRAEPGVEIRNVGWDLQFFFRRRTFDWYQSLFRNKSSQIAGEITPAYSILTEEQISSIQTLLPHLKIIFIMRNPIDRAWSHLRMAWRRAKLDLAEERQVFKLLGSSDSRLRSNYMKTIYAWEQFYPASQLLFAFFDEILEHPEAFLQRVYEFLGVNAGEEILPSQLRSAVHKGKEALLMPQYEKYLAELYYEEMIELHERFGGYATGWLQSTRQILSV